MIASEDHTAQEDDGTGQRTGSKQPGPVRAVITRGFSLVEDVVYVVLGLLLAASAAALLFSGAIEFWRTLAPGVPPQNIVILLDRLLLVLMIVELLYTVQVSFREHTLVPEPFLIVGLIAGTRRILVVTAQVATIFEKGSEAQFRSAMVELGVLTAMVVALVASLFLLRKRKGA